MSAPRPYTVVMTLSTKKRVITRALGLYKTRARAATAAKRHADHAAYEYPQNSYTFVVAPLFSDGIEPADLDGERP